MARNCKKPHIFWRIPEQNGSQRVRKRQAKPVWRGLESSVLAALEAFLEVLPMSPDINGIRLTGDVRAAGNDFDTLYKLSRLAYSDQVE